MKTKRIVVCASHQYSLRVATKHTRKVFAKIDAENAKLDQLEPFNENTAFNT